MAALRTRSSSRAAQRPTGGVLCSRWGPARVTDVADVNTQVDQEIMAFYKAREKLVHDRMARAQ